MRQNQRPNMAHVAERAGVSHQTVSRVVNGSPGVRPQTRERIERAIEELGYRRNNAARALVTRRSGLIGVIGSGSFLYGPTSTLVAIEEAARAEGYATLLAMVRKDDQRNVEEALEVCLDKAVEAVIIIAAQDDVLDRLDGLEAGVPVIVIGPDQSGAPTFTPHDILRVNQNEGARTAVGHLAGLGHRRLMVLAGPDHWVDAVQRTAGALTECEARGLTPELITGDWSPASGERAGHEIARRAPEDRPTAIFAANDAMALGLLSALNDSGLEIPREMSVVGFDDTPESGFFSPALTTVRQDFTALGHKVVSAAMARVREETPDLEAVSPELVVRGSSARPQAEQYSPAV